MIRSASPAPAAPACSSARPRRLPTSWLPIATPRPSTTTTTATPCTFSSMAAAPDVPDTDALVHPQARTVTDHTLGCFHRVPPLPRLDHLLRFLSTWGGTDKALMLTQYGLKVVIALLRVAVLARLRGSAKGSVSPESPAVALVPPLSKLSALCSDARVLYRIWTGLGMVQWMISMERNPPANKTLLNIERLQGWSMLVYAPMEAAAYLAGHGVLPISVPTQNKLWIHSCRLWAAYTVLQLLHIAEDTRLLRRDARALAKRGSTDVAATEKVPTSNLQAVKAALAARKDALITDFFVQLGYLPLTAHWYVRTRHRNETQTNDIAGLLRLASSPTCSSGYLVSLLAPPVSGAAGRLRHRAPVRSPSICAVCAPIE